MIEHANGGRPAVRTPKYNHKPIEMRKLPDCGFNQVGDFAWRFADGDVRLLVVAIPCIHHRGWIHSEWTIGHKNECGAQWSWDGNEDKPTLSPSLHAKGIWHGYVKEGKLVEA